MKSKTLGLVAVVLVAGPMAANAFVYTEATDLAGDQNSPTYIGALAAGSNTVSGFDSIASDGGGGQGDTFALALGTGLTLSSIELVISNFYGSDAFSARIFGPGFTNVSTINPTGNGTYAFPVTGFSAPTTVAFSTQFITGGASGFNWAWNINAAGPSSVPEPGTLALLGLGLAGLGLSRRRKAD